MQLWFCYSCADAIVKFSNPLNDSNCIDSSGKLNPKLPLCTGGIFATYPAPFLSLANGFLDQVESCMLEIFNVLVLVLSCTFSKTTLSTTFM